MIKWPSWLSKKDKTEFFIKPEDAYELAFVEEDGTENYRFKDLMNQGSQRALCAFDIYKEFSMGCDRPTLLKFIETNEAVLNNPKVIKIGDLARTNALLKERVQYIMPPNLFKQLASVVYFNKTENPYKYDYAYAREKIMRWDKQEKVLDFFLQTQLSGLVPRLKTYGQNSQSFLKLQESLHNQNLQSLTSILSRASSTKGKPS